MRYNVTVRGHTEEVNRFVGELVVEAESKEKAIETARQLAKINPPKDFEWEEDLESTDEITLGELLTVMVDEVTAEEES